MCACAPVLSLSEGFGPTHTYPPTGRIVRGVSRGQSQRVDAWHGEVVEGYGARKAPTSTGRSRAGPAFEPVCSADFRALGHEHLRTRAVRPSAAPDWHYLALVRAVKAMADDITSKTRNATDKLKELDDKWLSNVRSDMSLSGRLMEVSGKLTAEERHKLGILLRRYHAPIWYVSSGSRLGRFKGSSWPPSTLVGIGPHRACIEQMQNVSTLVC